MVQDRRLYQRLTPSSPQLVLLDESKYSLLFDLSESGLAVEGFAAQGPNSLTSLEFDMPEGSGCVQARAEIVWTSDSGYRTGLRFLDLPDASRQQLRDWIASTSASRMAVIESEVSKPIFGTAAGTQSIPFGTENKGSEKAVESPAFPMQPVLRSEPRRPFAEDDQEFASEGSALHLAAIFIAAVVMSSIAFLLGYYWRGGRPRPPVKQLAAATAPKAPGYSAGVPSPSPSQLPPQVVIPPILPLDNPGFVLQVAAMEQEGNADAFSNALRKKNFSAFVFHRDTDHFFRVAVGPYTDQSAAMRIKNDLEQEGYKPILRPWSP